MRNIVITITLILAVLTLASAYSRTAPVASANPNASFLLLSMPEEYVNYTITAINGTLWAKIDGLYPIYVLNQSGCTPSNELPMVYPMPPATINIHVFLNEHELSWTNYTEAHPDALHHTAIGEWWMIYSNIGPVSNCFELKIHYEHPLQIVNGSYLFLYDLNISPYLSPQSESSTAYFKIFFETGTTNFHAYTTQTDTIWSPINYTIKNENSIDVATIQMHSEYYKPSLGDLVIVFCADQVPEFSILTLPALMVTVFSMTLIRLKKKATEQKTEQNS
jgi:hypothetical protein